MTESSPQKPPIPPTRVLVVDDDALCVAALVLLLSEDSRIAVIDRNGNFLRQWQPDGMQTVHCMTVANDGTRVSSA